MEIFPDYDGICPLFRIAVRRMYKNRIQNTEQQNTEMRESENRETMPFMIYDLRIMIFESRFFLLIRVTSEIRGLNLMLFEKTKPICAGPKWRKVLCERRL